MRIFLIFIFLLAIPVFSDAQCRPPECINNIRGKVSSLIPGSSGLRLAQNAPGPIDPSKAYIVFDADTMEMADDATLPCCTKILVTPTAADASAFTYRISTMDSITIISPTVIMVANVTCSLKELNRIECFTPPLSQILPNLQNGKEYTIKLSRERLPQFHESVWSEPATFTTQGGVIEPPKPIDCVVSEWQEWSPFSPIPPIPPATVSTLESRHRNRTIIVQPMNGGLACPFLIETETRNIIVTPPVKQCMYIPLGGTVNVPKDVGTVIETSQQLITNRFRNNNFLTWGWKVDDYYQLNGNFDHIKITCRGLP